MTDSDAPDGPAAVRPLQVETHGLDVIGDADRKGTPAPSSGPGSAPTSPFSG